MNETTMKVDPYLYDSYRLTGIMDAIEFFSQRFEIDQLMGYAFEFVRSLIMPDQIALWSLNKGHYTLEHQSGYTTDFSFPFDEHYDQIVYFHAGLLYKKQLETLLPSDLYEIYQPDFCIPLIMDKSFFGLIAVKRTETPFNSGDEMMANALMNLLSTALTNYQSFKKLEESKAKLDEKVFNLFAMNQSSKALLSELSLKNLYDLSISVFSELTQSCLTTFFLKDTVSENYHLMSYKHVLNSHYKIDLILYPSKNTENLRFPVVVDMSNETQKNLFLGLFYNGNEIVDAIDPKYVVLLEKESKLVGFVTLGEKVNETVYDNSVFELVESLASSTYIAITNALHIEKINQQKKTMHNKLQELVKLNHLMKNMNSAQNHERVITLAMDTLNVTYGVDMGFFALYDSEKENFSISHRINMNNSCEALPSTLELALLFQGEPILIHESDQVDDLLPSELIEDFITPPSGAVLMPIFIKTFDIDVIGFFAIFKSRNKKFITEENLVSYEAIATHIAPVIHQLMVTSKLKELYQPDYNTIFQDQLAVEIKESLDFSLELYVAHYSKACTVCFGPHEILLELKKYFKKVYAIDRKNVFMILNSKEDIAILDRLDHKNYTKEVYQLRQHFEHMDDFKKLFI